MKEIYLQSPFEPPLYGLVDYDHEAAEISTLARANAAPVDAGFAEGFVANLVTLRNRLYRDAVAADRPFAGSAEANDFLRRSRARLHTTSIAYALTGEWPRRKEGTAHAAA